MMGTSVNWRFSWQVEVQKDGAFWQYGTDERIAAAQPILYTPTTGRRRDMPEETLSVGQTRVVWNWNEQNNFALMLFEIIDPVTALLQVEWSGDRPTSAADTTPSGAAVTWNAGPFIGFGAPIVFTSTQILTNATELNHVGSGSAIGGTGPIAASGEEIGRMYEVRVKNAGTAVLRYRGGTLVN